MAGEFWSKWCILFSPKALQVASTLIAIRSHLLQQVILKVHVQPLCFASSTPGNKYPFHFNCKLKPKTLRWNSFGEILDKAFWMLFGQAASARYQNLS